MKNWTQVSINHDKPLHQLEGATRARHKVLGLLFSLGALTYLDRLCISAAAPAIIRDFNFSPTQMGYVFSAFTLAYALFEVPSGWLGDHFGTRKALTRIVLWWSAFTMMTGAALGFTSLMILRFLFGVGEAGAFPNTARTVSRWFPTAQRGRALSVAFIGQTVGATFTTPLVFLLINLQGWRLTFIEFGALGLVWCVVWYRWFRDLPEEHPSVNSEELRLIRTEQISGEELDHSLQIPWRVLLTSRNLVFICAMYFAYGYALYFYVTWLPTYLIKARGFSTAYVGLFSSLPWIASGCGLWFGGWATDWLVKRTGSLKIGRCTIGALGFTISALALIVAASTSNSVLSASLIAVAACFQLMTGTVAWATCLDIGRQNAGVVTGLMNMVGNLGGTIAPVVVGYILESWNSWRFPFYVTATLLLLGGAMWLLIEPGKPLLTRREFHVEDLESDG